MASSCLLVKEGLLFGTPETAISALGGNFISNASESGFKYSGPIICRTGPEHVGQVCQGAFTPVTCTI